MSVAVTNSKKHHSIKKRPSPVAFFVHVCNLRNHLASNKYIFPISPIMTNKYFLLIMIMLSSASCRQNDSFTLSGDLQGLKAGDTLLFEAYEPAFYTPTSQDTLIIEDNNTFWFTIPAQHTTFGYLEYIGLRRLSEYQHLRWWILRQSVNSSVSRHDKRIGQFRDLIYP